MNKVRTLTEQEFNARVQKYWETMVTSSYPTFPCPPVQHDRAKRRTNNLGMAHYSPIQLSFSYRLLDGRYNLVDIDDVIKHEIGHLLAYHMYGDCQGHNAKFKQLGRKFGFNAAPTSSIKTITGFKDPKPPKKYKYKVTCPGCNVVWLKTRATNITKNPQIYFCSCGCGKCLEVERLY